MAECHQACPGGKESWAKMAELIKIPFGGSRKNVLDWGPDLSWEGASLRGGGALLPPPQKKLLLRMG